MIKSDIPSNFRFKLTGISSSSDISPCSSLDLASLDFTSAQVNLQTSSLMHAASGSSGSKRDTKPGFFVVDPLREFGSDAVGGLDMVGVGNIVAINEKKERSIVGD